MAREKNNGVQVVVGPSGDAMLVLPISKKLVATLGKKDVSIALAEAAEMTHLKQCLARYDLFRFNRDIVVNPVAEIAAARAVAPAATRRRRRTAR